MRKGVKVQDVVLLASLHQPHDATRALQGPTKVAWELFPRSVDFLNNDNRSCPHRCPRQFGPLLLSDAAQ